jgi:hypothetical protein
MTKTIRESVLDEITRLFEDRGKVPVCRQDVVQATGIRAEALREHIDALLDDGLLYRVDRGLYAPVDHRPTRPISITDLPDGSVKIEVGDEMICLSANEHKIVAARMGAKPVSELVNPGMATALSLSIEQHVRSLARAAQQMREATQKELAL